VSQQSTAMEFQGAVTTTHSDDMTLPISVPYVVGHFTLATRQHRMRLASASAHCRTQADGDSNSVLQALGTEPGSWGPQSRRITAYPRNLSLCRARSKQAPVEQELQPRPPSTPKGLVFRSKFRVSKGGVRELPHPPSDPKPEKGLRPTRLKASAFSSDSSVLSTESEKAHKAEELDDDTFGSGAPTRCGSSTSLDEVMVLPMMDIGDPCCVNDLHAN